ncbi:MAG: tetratricopeptide repeat protein [Cytophagales bacterium]|nr:tetratricopeptide repeat protein [Cytophagales bacterium]
MKVKLLIAFLLFSFVSKAQDGLGTPEATQFYQTGSKLLKEEKYAEAKIEFNKALAINRQNPEYHYARGLTHYHMGKRHSAINDLNRAINLDNTQSNYFYYLGIIYHDLEDFAKSNEFMALTLENNATSFLKVSEANVQFHIGVNHIKLEDYSRAHEVFADILQTNPKHTSALINRGIALGFMERYEEACSDFTQASSLGSSNASAYMKKYCNGDKKVVANP